MIMWIAKGLRQLDERRWDLGKYRIEQARESLKASEIMLDNNMVKDSQVQRNGLFEQIFENDCKCK